MTKTEKNELKEQMAVEVQQWLDQGNEITVFPPGLRTEPEDMQYKHKWGGGGRKKKAE